MAASTKLLMLFCIGHIGSLSGQETNPCKSVKIGVVAHTTTCSKYYQCNNNRGNLRTCKVGENFNPTTKTCVKANQYQCPITTTATTTTTTTTTAPTTTATTTTFRTEAPTSITLRTEAPTSTTLKTAASTTTTLRTEAPTSTTLKTAALTRTTITTGYKCSPQEENLKQFTRHEFKGTSYYISNDIHKSDDAAAKLCETICGYLVEVDNQEEEDYMHSIMRSQNTGGVLITGTDQYEEGVWEIARNRRPVNYLNWHGGEPNDYGQKEDCMCIYNDKVGIYDCSCTGATYKERFVCEVKWN